MLENQKIGIRRSLYECFHAHVKGHIIYCDRGHYFHEITGKGELNLDRLAKGHPLVFSICQACADFESMGKTLLPEEKGWQRNNHCNVNQNNTGFPLKPRIGGKLK